MERDSDDNYLQQWHGGGGGYFNIEGAPSFAFECVGVSEILASLEELGRLNADERREVEACGTYCC